MNALSVTEVKVLNNLTDVRDPSVDLGTKLQQVITDLTKVGVISGTPVNAAKATMDLELSGVVIHGETVVINNPAVPGTDTYEFLADVAQIKSNPANIAVDISAAVTPASRTLSLPTQPTSGDTMTIGTKVYTFVPVGTDTADGEVSIGADLAGAQAAIVAAINGTDGVNEAHPLVSAAPFALDNCIISALIGGVAGDDIATTETFTAAGNVFAGVKLAGGADCSAALAITALVAAITASDTQGVGAVDGAGDIVTLTADVAGAAGNNIALAETLANAVFTGGAVSMFGGVNGTPGSLMQPMIDASYLYLCVANNTLSGQNWRRISLGAAF